MRLTSALVTTSLAVTLAVPVTVVAAATSATSAGAATTACQATLDPARKSVYRFTRSGTTLPYGQVVVQATKANPHRYCVRFSTGGRNVFAASSNGGYVRSGGECRATGQAAGDSGYYTRGFSSDLQVADGTCVGLSYSIRDNGVWYSTIRILRWNDKG